jgi:hypothetical protein
VGLQRGFLKGRGFQPRRKRHRIQRLQPLRDQRKKENLLETKRHKMPSNYLAELGIAAGAG